MESIKIAREAPLTTLIKQYCSEYESLRDNNLDLPHISFHRSYGLTVDSPESWGVLNSVKSVIDSFLEVRKIVVIFSSTVAYKKIYDFIGEKVRYLSWHEIFTGMHVAQQDVRYIQKSKQILGDSDLTFFLNPPPLPEVINQVKGQTVGALIILSGGDLDI